MWSTVCCIILCNIHTRTYFIVLAYWQGQSPWLISWNAPIAMQTIYSSTFHLQVSYNIFWSLSHDHIFWPLVPHLLVIITPLLIVQQLCPLLLFLMLCWVGWYNNYASHLTFSPLPGERGSEWPFGVYKFVFVLTGEWAHWSW